MFRQPVHSADADVYAIITQKGVSDFVSSEPFTVIRIDMGNQENGMLVLLVTGGRLQ